MIANSFARCVATCYEDRYTCDLGTDLKRVLALPTLQKLAYRSLCAMIAVHSLSDARRV